MWSWGFAASERNAPAEMGRLARVSGQVSVQAGGAGALWRDFVVSKTNKERLIASTLLAGVASLGVPMAIGGAVMMTATDAHAQD
jgi:hypothetical protein